MEIINFTTESLSFQNSYLNGAHSISTIKLPWKNRRLSDLNLLYTENKIWRGAPKSAYLSFISYFAIVL